MAERGTREPRPSDAWEALLSVEHDPETSLQKFQARLGPDEAVLRLSIDHEATYLWLIDESAIDFRKLASAKEVERSLDLGLALLRASTALGRDTKVQLGLGALSMQLLPDDLVKPGARRLLVIADGALARVPFAALPVPRNWDGAKGTLLIDHFEIVAVESVGALLRLKASPPPVDPTNWRTLIVGDPALSPDDSRLSEKARARAKTRALIQEDAPLRFPLPNLPSAAEEARVVAAMMHSATTLVGPSATKERVLRSTAQQPTLIHIATHAVQSEVGQHTSSLVLTRWDAEGEEQDWLLTTDEIARLSVRAALVVLSACSTSGSLAEGSSPSGMSLAGAFRAAGVPTTVSTLWPVDDEASVLFMREFYLSLLLDRKGPSEALRYAQLKLRAQPRRSSPFFWAAYVLEGDWRVLGGS